MEFKSLKNIESSFRHLRLFGIVYLCVCTLLVGFSVWKAYSFAEAQREKIYVLDEGKSLMLALSQDLEQNRPVEAREHVRRFHELFFTLSPDKNAIEGNIRRAMFLSDRSAYAHYVDLAEQGYYNRIISGNVNQRVGIDSVKCDFHTYPYEVVTYAKLSIIREKSVTERSLVTRGRLLNSTRSDNNPHGFILEAFRVVENRDIRVYDRYNSECMKKMFVKIKESAEEKLRKLCAGLSPEKRVPAIVMLAALFAIGNFYMIFRAIHDIGREDVRPEIIEIPPIEIPDVVPADTLPDKRVQEMEEFFNRFNQKENE